MRNYLIAGAMLAASAAAADAALYRYDISMERTSAEYNRVYGQSIEEPTGAPEGVTCIGPSPYLCEGGGAEDAFDLDRFPEMISAIYEFSTIAGPESARCYGGSLLCAPLGRGLELRSLTSSADGFDLRATNVAGGFIVNEKGLSYADDGLYSFDFGGVEYSALGIDVNYATTSLTISAIPVPAALPMLGFGAIALASFARRKKRAN